MIVMKRLNESVVPLHGAAEWINPHICTLTPACSWFDLVRV